LISGILTYRTYFKVLLCKVKQNMYMNTRQWTKGGNYQSTLQLQLFPLWQNKVESFGFHSKCAEHVVLRRTVLAVLLPTAILWRRPSNDLLSTT